MPHTHIILPVERHAQLHTLAQALGGVSLADAIAHMLNEQIVAGTIPDELLGLSAKRASRGKVNVEIEGVFAEVLPIKLALGIADTLEAMAEPGKQQRGSFDVDAGVTITRKGAGMIVANPYTGKSRSLSPSLAKDFARQLRSAAA